MITTFTNQVSGEPGPAQSVAEARSPANASGLVSGAIAGR